MRRGKVKMEKAPAGITLEKVTTVSCRRWRWCSWHDNEDRADDGDVGVVRINLWGASRSLAVVETTYSQGDDVTNTWLKEIASLLRAHRLRAPLVAGLVALRGRPSRDWHWKSTGPRGNPQDPDNPIRCVALCVGGSHALVYHPECYKHKHTGSLLVFSEHNKMKQLREFLADKRVIVACVGAGEVAKKLADEWGLHVARPAELTDLFARAYGKVVRMEPEMLPGKPVKPEKVYYRMRGEAEERARAKAMAHAEAEEQEYVEKSKQGRWMPKVIKRLSMEYMARVALGPDMRLAPWPAKLADADWGASHDRGNDEWMYATRDAYLCFDIAACCLPKIGVPVG